MKLPLRVGNDLRNLVGFFVQSCLLIDGQARAADFLHLGGRRIAGKVGGGECGLLQFVRVFAFEEPFAESRGFLLHRLFALFFLVLGADLFGGGFGLGFWSWNPLPAEG